VPLLDDLVIEELNLIVSGQDLFVAVVVAVVDHLVSGKDSVDVVLENLRLKLNWMFIRFYFLDFRLLGR